MKKELGIDAELIRGSGGVFEVELYGRLIYSKREKGRFPEEGEVTDLIKEKI